MQHSNKFSVFIYSDTSITQCASLFSSRHVSSNGLFRCLLVECKAADSWEKSKNTNSIL